MYILVKLLNVYPCKIILSLSFILIYYIFFDDSAAKFVWLIYFVFIDQKQSKIQQKSLLALMR